MVGATRIYGFAYQAASRKASLVQGRCESEGDNFFITIVRPLLE